MHLHGEFDIQQHGQILIVRCTGSWNIYTGRLLRDSLLNHGGRMTESPWAILMDVSDWGLGPMEMWPLMAEVKEWAVRHNQIAEAVVFRSLAQKKITAQLYNSAPDLNTEYFRDYAEAFEWLSEQGLKHNDGKNPNSLFQSSF